MLLVDYTPSPRLSKHPTLPPIPGGPLAKRLRGGRCSRDPLNLIQLTLAEGVGARSQSEDWRVRPPAPPKLERHDGRYSRSHRHARHDRNDSREPQDPCRGSTGRQDRKSGVLGGSVSVRVDYCGMRLNKKNINKEKK